MMMKRTLFWVLVFVMILQPASAGLIKRLLGFEDKNTKKYPDNHWVLENLNPLQMELKPLDTKRPEIKIGMQVTLRNLKAEDILVYNGRTGVVVCHSSEIGDAGNRWVVQFSDGERVGVKDKNLELPPRAVHPDIPKDKADIHWVQAFNTYFKQMNSFIRDERAKLDNILWGDNVFKVKEEQRRVIVEDFIKEMCEQYGLSAETESSLKHICQLEAKNDSNSLVWPTNYQGKDILPLKTIERAVELQMEEFGKVRRVWRKIRVLILGGEKVYSRHQNDCVTKQHWDDWLEKAKGSTEELKELRALLRDKTGNVIGYLHGVFQKVYETGVKRSQ